MKHQEYSSKTVGNMDDKIEENETENNEKISTSLPVDQVAASTEEVSEAPEGRVSAKRTFLRIGSRPSRQMVLTACAFWGVILLGAILRFWDLEIDPCIMMKVCMDILLCNFCIII